MENTMTRWMVAAGSALALAFLTLPPVDTLAGLSFSSGVEAAAPAVCDAKTKPANLTFTLKDMDGADVKLSTYKGKVIVLDFWATWCGPCKVEIPAFVELQTKYRDQGLVILGLSVDDPLEKLKPFATQYKMNYPVLVGRDRDDVQDAYGPIWGIPTTFVIGRDGNICKKHMGMTTKEQFEKVIKALI
jgi:cytochrome c biogenesis protein CcmG/thiol:disulfide interchange protein DsbE